LCALYVSKAFDKTNHYGIYLRLMDISIPNELLMVLENWFSKCFTCVRWGAIYSSWFKLRCGVRQGVVLSPYLFALYVDVIIEKVRQQRIGCCIGSFCVSILLYADDMLLLAPSLEALQQLVLICENELSALDLSINAKKSVCTSRYFGSTTFDISAFTSCAFETSSVASTTLRSLCIAHLMQYLGRWVDQPLRKL